MMEFFRWQQPFLLESGKSLPELTIAYHTYGQLNEARDNVVWVCHALTASSDALDWWNGVAGNGGALDPDRFFIVCANILGSCYGTTGPLSIHPHTGKPFYGEFPFITIRDMVRAHQLLCDHLGIKKIFLLAGGSMGGYQVLEWALMEPAKIDRLFVICTSARESPWGIAIHTAQRMAIEADQTWAQPQPEAGSKGLKAARAIGMLTYRNYHTYLATQAEDDPEKVDHFKAESYIQYQGEKLVKRFNAYSYWYLTRAMDSHNLARGRGGHLEAVLKTIRQKVLLIGITNDILCPFQELEFLNKHIPFSDLFSIFSLYGHDGFLTEPRSISSLINQWLGSDASLP